MSLSLITCGLMIAAASASEGRALASYRGCGFANHIAHLKPSMFLLTLSSIWSIFSGQRALFSTLPNICSLDYPHLLLILSFSGAFLLSSLRKLSKVCIYPCRQLYTVYLNALWLYSWPGEGSTWYQQPSFLPLPLLSAAWEIIFRCSLRLNLCLLRVLCLKFSLFPWAVLCNRRFLLLNC